MTAVTPAGSHATRSANPSWSLRSCQGQQLVGEEAEVARDPRHHRVAHRAQERAVVASLDGRQLGHARLDAVGDRVQDLARDPSGASRPRWRTPPGPRPPPRRPHRRRLRARPRRSGASSMGETSANVGRRRPRARHRSSGRSRPRHPQHDTTVSGDSPRTRRSPPRRIVRSRTVWGVPGGVKRRGPRDRGAQRHLSRRSAPRARAPLARAGRRTPADARGSAPGILADCGIGWASKNACASGDLLGPRRGTAPRRPCAP